MKWSERQKTAIKYLENASNRHIEEVFYGGGAGGGKTFLGCHWQIARRIHYAGTRGFIGRKTLIDLKLTTLRTFFDVWAKWYAPFHRITIRANVIQDKTIFFSNGSEIIIRDLPSVPSDPDYNYLGSLELTDAFIDEVPEIEERAFAVLSSRVRYKIGEVGGKKVLCTGNPQNNWAKRRWVIDDTGQKINLPEHIKFVQSLVDDNPDKEFVANYKGGLEKLPAYDRARLLFGDWTVDLNETPFFPSFNSKMITKGITIDQDHEVWLSFDFNIDPTTVIVAQRIPYKGCFIIDCLQARGGTEKLCDKLLDAYDYPDMGYKVTGDRSGSSGSSVAGILPGGVYNTDFEIIKRKLRIGNTHLIDTRTANARYEHSYRLCDMFFQLIPFKMNNLPILVNDLKTAQWTKNGKLRKDRDNFKQDAGDAFRYLPAAWFRGRSSEIVKFSKQFDE